MSAVTANLTLNQFRAAYGECKPYYELLNGEPTLPAKPHAILQGTLYLVLREFGFQSTTELTFVPEPDVASLLPDN